MDYDKYYQKGGHYEIPTEVFNDLLEQLSQLQQEKEEFEKIIKKILIQIRDYKNIFNRLENIHYSHVERELEAIEYKIQIGLDGISKLKESDKDVSRRSI
jgi:uncharacterized protein HemY